MIAQYQLQQLKAHYRVNEWLQMQTSIHRRAVVSFNTQPGEYGRKTKKQISVL